MTRCAPIMHPSKTHQCLALLAPPLPWPHPRPWDCAHVEVREGEGHLVNSQGKDRRARRPWELCDGKGVLEGEGFAPSFPDHEERHRTHMGSQELLVSLGQGTSTEGC